MKHALIRRKLARVDRALDKAIADAEIPGAVVLARMRREGEWLEHCSVRGLAVVRPERIPMARETVFDLASLTKPIATATAVMLLVAEGAIDLDEPVVKYVPAAGERGKDQMRVRHLLTHSAGLKPWRPFHEALLERERKKGERLLGTPAAKEAILERIHRSTLVHEPGEAAVYGDLDFMLLGELVETVAKRPLDEFCAERIFAPLGLADTRFARLGDGQPPLPDALRRRFAATENCPWRGRILWGEVHDPNAWAMGGVAGHAGLFAPADDVLRFASAVLDAWHGRNEADPVLSRVLPREWLRRFLTRQEGRAVDPEGSTLEPEGSALEPEGSAPKPEGSAAATWTLGWDTPTPGASSSGRYFTPGATVGHLGFTGTSLWIDLAREAVVVMLTNRVHLVAKRSPFKLRAVVHDLVMESFLAE